MAGVDDMAVPVIPAFADVPNRGDAKKLKCLAIRHPWLAGVANHVALHGTMDVGPFDLGMMKCTGKLTYDSLLTLPEHLDGLDGEIEERFELIARENKIAAFSRRTSA